MVPFQKKVVCYIGEIWRIRVSRSLSRVWMPLRERPCGTNAIWIFRDIYEHLINNIFKATVTKTKFADSGTETVI